MVTIKNLSKILKLDISTVSRALRDDPRVKYETKLRVKELAEVMGYTPNFAARSLAKGVTRTIWLIVPVINDPVEIKAPQYVSQMLAKLDYDLMVAIHHNDEGIYERLLTRLKQGVADGAFILKDYQRKSCPIVDELVAQNYPIVFLDRYDEDLKTNVVSTDNSGSAGNMAKLICYEGVTQFFVLYNQKYVNIVEQNRLAGAIEEIEKSNLTYSVEQDISSDEISHCEKIAVMASTQNEVLKFYKDHYEILKNKEIYFSVFDSWAGESTPAKKVFVCQQDLEEICRVAVDKLLLKMENKLPNEREIIRIPAKAYNVIE